MTRKKVPFLHAPPPLAERMTCGYCHKPLRPEIHEEHVRIQKGEGFTYEPASRTWTGRYRAYGNFCTMRCAVDFANVAYKHGYRIREATK